MSPDIDPQNQTPKRLPSSLFNLLSQLIRSPSVVGAEHSFFRVLQRELEERGARVWTSTTWPRRWLRSPMIAPRNSSSVVT